MKKLNMKFSFSIIISSNISQIYAKIHFILNNAVPTYSFTKPDKFSRKNYISSPRTLWYVKTSRWIVSVR